MLHQGDSQLQETTPGSIIQTVRSTGQGGSTQTGQVVGTPAYMPPEQANGLVGQTEARSDVFGLGAVLCELLTGRPPYVTERGMDTLLLAATADLVDAHTRLNQCGADAGLITLAKSCLNVRRENRPEDAGTVADAVARYQAGVEARLRQAEVERAAAEIRAREERKRRRVSVALAASVLLTALAGGGVWLWYAQQRAARDATVRAVLADVEAHTEKGNWPEAMSSAKRTEAMVQAGDGDAATRQQVQAMLAHLHLLELLADIRTRKGDEFDPADTDRDYQRAFADAGIDLDALSPEEAAARIRARPGAIALELIAALDNWTLEHLAREQPEKSWRHLQMVAQRADTDPWRNRLRDVLGRSDLAAARQLADEADVTKLSAMSAQLLGQVLEDSGDHGRAVELLRQAVVYHPHDVWLNYQLAWLLEKQELPAWAEAVGYYRAARAVRPEVGHALAHALQKLDKQDEALAIFRELTRLRPDNARHLNCLGNALGGRKQYDEDIATFRQAIAIDPKFAPAYYNLGTALAKRKQYDEAIAAYRQAIAINPKDAMAYNGLGAALAGRRQYDEAVSAHRQAIAIDPEFAPAYYNLGTALADKNQYDEAIAAFRQAIALDAKLAKPYYNLGKALRAKNQLEEAIAAFRQAIAITPNFAEAHCELGQCLGGQGKLAEALASLRRGHELGQQTSGWHYPSAQWVQTCEHLLETDQKLSAVLRGERQPKNTAERLQLAYFCQERFKKLYVTAVRFYIDAFADEPKLAHNLSQRHRYNAASAAVLAATGQEGQDAEKLDEKERTRWRQQALDWLRADLIANAKFAKDQPKSDAQVVRQRMQHWQRNPDLASVRDKDALAKLPEAERQAWQHLWQDVHTLLEQLAQPAGKPEP